MKFLTFTLSLALGLTSLASATPVPSEDGITLPREIQCSEKGGTCAGFAGIPCCDGLKCVGIPPNVADGTGYCASQCATEGGMCAGFAGIPCCGKLKCDGIPPNVADGAGWCSKY